MKFQNLLLTIFAAGALLVGCEKEEPAPALPVLTVGQTELTFEQGGGTATVSVTSNRPWTISTDADWLAFSPANGQAADAPVSVTVTALANSSNDRTSSFKVKTDFDYKTVTVTQAGAKGEDPNTTPTGKGTVDDPYNVVAAINAVADLSWSSSDDYQSTDVVYMKGIITSIADAGTYTEGGSYGNASFHISTDGTSVNDFYVYRALYLGNKKFKTGQTDIKVGDEVIICGKLMNYRGNTPETVAGEAFLYSLNGVTGGQGGDEPAPKGSGTLEDPYNPTGAAAAVAGLKWIANDNYETTEDVYVKGIISSIADKGTYSESGTFGNATFYISEDGSDNGEFYVYRTKYFDNKAWKTGQTDIKVGDEVIIYGKLMNYRGNTPETVASGTYLYSLNGETGQGGEEQTGEAKGTGTLEDPYNPVAATAAVKGFKWTSNDNYDKTDEVYVKGIISAIAEKGTFAESGTFGNASFYISEDGSTNGQFYVYRAMYLGNNKWKTGQTDIKVGDEVIIHGMLMNYRGNTPETVANGAYVYSLNGETGEGGQGGDETKEVTVAEAIAAANDSNLKVGPALVVASSSSGFLMEQEGAMIYVFKGEASVGDIVIVEAKRDEFGGAPQLSSPSVETVSNNNPVTHPDPVDISSKFDSYTSSDREYVSLTGTLNISGNYYNITVPGATTVTGSILKPEEDISSFDGKSVTITGYYLYHTSQGKYLYVIATNIQESEGGDEPGGDEPEETTISVAEAIAAAKDTKVNVGPALVVASASTGFLMEQDGAMIYVFKGVAAVGDSVTVKGTRAEYSGTPQLSDVNITIKSSGETVTRPEPKDITASIGSYTSSDREYVTFTGKLNISGNYYNVTIDGVENVTGSVLKPNENIEALNGKNVDVTGYYLYHTSQGKYLNVIATEIKEAAGGDEPGGDEPGGDEPEDAPISVAEAIAAAKDTKVNVGPALVVASASTGFLMEQGGAMIYVFKGVAAVGDSVTVEGTRAEYSGTPQLADPVVTKVSSGETVTRPEPKDITANIGSYTSSDREYVTFTGTLNISGNYYNVTIDGVENVTGSVLKPNENIEALNGKNVDVTGYYLYHTSQGKYLNVIATEIKEAAGGEEPGGDEPEETTISVAEAIAAAKDTKVNVGPALVVASASTGFLMEQDGAMIYVYKGVAAVGDIVTVEGTKAEYSGTPQLSDVNITIKSSGETVTRPEPKDITANIGSYTSSDREYVTFSGKLNISGNYYNVTIDGVENVTGSVLKPNENIDSLNGKNVDVTGYYLYHTSQGKYLNVIATEIKEAPGGEEPGGDEPTNLIVATVAEFLAAEDSKTQPYQLTGKVSNITNTTYGNFDLTDETGTIYVYGLVASDQGGYDKNKNGQTFSTIGIKENDVITIVGFRETYTDKNGNTKNEAVGSYYVSGASGGDEEPESGDVDGGNTESIDFSTKGYENGQAIESFKGTDVTITFNKGTNSNAPKYYNTGTAIRVYGSNYFTISSSKTITAIKFTFGSGDGSNEISADKGSISGNSWTGSATSVKFSIGGTSGHRRIKALSITFAE